MKTLNLLIASLAFACLVAIAGYEVSSVWFAGDRMVGFVFLFTLTLAMKVVLVCLGVAAFRKSWLIAACTLIGGLLAIAPLFLGPFLIFKSWNNSISQFANVNAAAITQADLTGFEYSPDHGLYQMDMQPVPEFKWYCDHPVAAPDGVFHAFTVKTVPHVYINKIRNGAKGMAYAPDKSMLPTDSEFHYQFSGVDSWYIWSY